MYVVLVTELGMLQVSSVSIVAPEASVHICTYRIMPSEQSSSERCTTHEVYHTNVVVHCVCLSYTFVGNEHALPVDVVRNGPEAHSR